MISRTKPDSVELDGDAKPVNAHIAQVEIEDEAGAPSLDALDRLLG